MTKLTELQGGPLPRGPRFCLLIFEKLRTYVVGHSWCFFVLWYKLSHICQQRIVRKMMAHPVVQTCFDKSPAPNSAPNSGPAITSCLLFQKLRKNLLFKNQRVSSTRDILKVSSFRQGAKEAGERRRFHRGAERVRGGGGQEELVHRRDRRPKSSGIRQPPGPGDL